VLNIIAIELYNVKESKKKPISYQM